MASSPAAPDLGFAGSTHVIVAIGGLVVAAGVALGVVRYIDPGGLAAERSMEGVIGALALGAVVAAPGVMALLALADRPAMLLPAGVILMPLSFLSLAGVTLPLLIPAVMLVIAYARRSASHAPIPARTALGTTIVVALLIAAAISLFVHQDPRSYSTPTVSGSTSDVITPVESLISLALLAAAITLGWILTSPPARSPDLSRVRRIR